MGSDGKKISAEELISKLKDDGDFDRLRLKIIRQLKQNEDLRNNIISVVKQSAALNRAGAEKMKPRELCDAIHDEVREKVMGQISDGLWEIIRSGDGMKTEITETVQSVYNQMVNPQGEAKGESPTKGAEFNGSAMVAEETNGSLPDGEVNEPPGSSLQNHIGSNNHEQQSQTHEAGPSGRMSQEQGREPYPHGSNGSLPSETEDGEPSPPPSFSLSKRKHPSDGTDEDPDIPPGFG